jgi:hypothetical protein
LTFWTAFAILLGYEYHECYEYYEYLLSPPPPKNEYTRVFNAVYAVITKSKIIRALAEEIKASCCFSGIWTSSHMKRLVCKNYKPEHKVDKGCAEKYNRNVISVNEVMERKLCYKLSVIMLGDFKWKNYIKRYGISFIAEKYFQSIFYDTYFLFIRMEV